MDAVVVDDASSSSSFLKDSKSDDASSSKEERTNLPEVLLEDESFPTNVFDIPLPTDSSASTTIDCASSALKVNDMITSLKQGKLTKARHQALQLQQDRPQCESTLAKHYQQHANEWLESEPFETRLLQYGAHMLMEQALTSSDDDAVLSVTRQHDVADCWIPNSDLDLEQQATMVMDLWDLCCSQLEPTKNQESRSKKKEKECYNNANISHRTPSFFCCAISPTNLNYLRLPALQEIILPLTLPMMPFFPNGNDIQNDKANISKHSLKIMLHQDGFLRRFDTAGVLWPTGYFLALCLASPLECGISHELQSALAVSSSTQNDNNTNSIVAMELGAGVGLPSVVLAHQLHQMQNVDDDNENNNNTIQVVATDRSLAALALVLQNSQQPPWKANIMVQHLPDHANITFLQELLQQQKLQPQGYAVVLGSSLQSLFDFQTQDPNHPLWQVLDVLLDRSNPHAMAILCHVKDAVVPPRLSVDAGDDTTNPNSPSLRLTKTVSGNQLGLFTRSGDDSDFEISVYQRQLAKQSKWEEGTVADEL